MYFLCLCVSVCDFERERGREKEKERGERREGEKGGERKRGE